MIAPFLHKFWEEMKEIHRSLRVFKNVKSTYGHMSANRFDVNLINQDALLFAGVTQEWCFIKFHFEDYRCQHVFFKEIHSEKDLCGAGWG